jgi:hypothetical protein
MAIGHRYWLIYGIWLTPDTPRPAPHRAANTTANARAVLQLSAACAHVCVCVAHLFHPDTEKFPIHARASYSPDPTGLKYADMGGWTVSQPSGDVVDDYAESLRQRGVHRSVVVHPEPYGDDHRVVLHALERQPGWLGTSLFYPSDGACETPLRRRYGLAGFSSLRPRPTDDAPTKLQALVCQQPRIVSTRFHAHRNKHECHTASSSTQFGGAGAMTTEIPRPLAE